MVAILFLLACALWGVTITAWLPINLRAEERIWMGLPIGLAVGSLLTFVVALVVGFTATEILAVSGLLIVSSFINVDQLLRRQRWLDSFRELPARLRLRRNWIPIFTYAMFAVALALIMSHAVFYHDGAIYASFTNVWGDWSQHLAQVTSFAYGHNFPPQQPVMSGQRLSYPFMANWLSALLVKGGLSLLPAMVLPGVLLVWSALGMLMTLGRVMAGRGAALLMPVLFFLAGGLGFVNFFADLANAHQSLGYFLAHMPHTYTQSGNDVLVTNINWINPIYAYVLPQRALLFGLPIVLTVLWFLYVGIQDRRQSLMLAGGLTAMLLPFVHTHGLLFLGFVTPILFLNTRRLVGPGWISAMRFWLPFAIPILLVGLPQFLWLTSGLNSTKFLRAEPGWLAKNDNVAWFWLKNLGAFLPLLVVGIVGLRQRYVLLTNFTLAASAVFITANIYVFQPWDWDNTKLFIYWFVASLPLVALVLARLWRGRWRWAVTVIVVTMVLAGTADVVKVLQWPNYKIQMFSFADRSMAAYIRSNTKPDSVFLTAQNVGNPISGLAGRPIVLGYTGWLWSYGLDYQQREKDVRQMMEGAGGTQEYLRLYNVNYVVIGPNEHSDQGYHVNEAYYQIHYQLWHRFGNTAVYDVSAPLAMAR